MQSPPPLQAAIIGAGPSGCYLAQALTRTIPETEITVFEQEIAPYGLLRSGVAADHQHTKHLARQFERVLQQPGIRYAGNVRIVTDHTTRPNATHTTEHAPDQITRAENTPAEITLDELHAHYDVVIHATGLTADRPLTIPGSELQGVYGASQIFEPLNAAPGAPETLPPVGSHPVIIGMGNVALDLLRFLVKSDEHYTHSDISATALDSYLTEPAQHITVVSRSAPENLNIDPALLSELERLPRARYEIIENEPTRADTPSANEYSAAQNSRLIALAALTRSDRPHYPGPHVTLRFTTTPARIHGGPKVDSVTLHTPHPAPNQTSEHVTATSVLTAIGFTHGSSNDDAASNHTYAVGWARRGALGGIPANRICAKQVADEIAHHLTTGALTTNPQKTGFNGVPHSVQQHAVSFTQWLQLDAYELAHAQPERVRTKTPNRTTMHHIATTQTTTQ